MPRLCIMVFSCTQAWVQLCVELNTKFHGHCQHWVLLSRKHTFRMRRFATLVGKAEKMALCAAMKRNRCGLTECEVVFKGPKKSRVY